MFLFIAAVGHPVSVPEGRVQAAEPRFAVRRLLISADANPKTSSDYRDKSRDQAIALLKSTNATHYHFNRQWSELERQPGVFELTTVRRAIATSKPLPWAFALKIIDAGARQMPESYKTLAWDSPEMVQRVTRLVEELAPVLGNRPRWYAVGNEIDMYFAQRPHEVAAYARLLERIKPIIRARHPAASFTTTLQFSSVPQWRTLYAPIVETLDHVGLTYYPLAADFVVRPPTDFVPDLTRALDAARPLPIAFQEIGYPTSPLLRSSPERQAEFMRVAFEAIREAGTRQVLGATYLFQADLPQWLVNDLVRAYGEGGENFRAFLTTLGLRDDRDRAKPGWDEFVRQAELVGPKLGR
jgi:hypothetical protein